VERSVSFIPTISRDLREALEQPCRWAKVIFCATMTALHPGFLHVDGRKTRCAHGQAECPPRYVKIWTRSPALRTRSRGEVRCAQPEPVQIDLVATA
jgi:hypothetical protein